jgi:hopanoid biosynthesis associated protein HpnK
MMQGTKRGRALIVTADDFGLSLPVNEAIEDAHRNGILTTASLMVAADATADAVRRARQLPNLRVGLHVVVVNGRPLLPPSRVPDLVGERGEFMTDLGRAGVRFFFRPGARRQLEDEIRAQFEAFAATGLQLDHVNAQNHMHVHPTVLGTILRVGRDYGMRAVRVPYEPFLPSWRSAHRGLAVRLGNGFLLAPWLALMKARLRHVPVACNDFIFGMSDTGRMTAERVLQLLPCVPIGVSEIYFHPSTQPGSEAREYQALIDPEVIRALQASGVRRVTFDELATSGA